MKYRRAMYDCLLTFLYLIFYTFYKNLRFYFWQQPWTFLVKKLDSYFIENWQIWIINRNLNNWLGVIFNRYLVEGCNNINRPVIHPYSSVVWRYPNMTAIPTSSLGTGREASVMNRVGFFCVCVSSCSAVVKFHYLKDIYSINHLNFVFHLSFFPFISSSCGWGSQLTSIFVYHMLVRLASIEA